MRRIRGALVTATLALAAPSAHPAKVLVVGLHPPAPPFQSGDVAAGGAVRAPRGLDVDLARAIGTVLHASVTFRYVPHAEGYFSAGRKPWDIGLGHIEVSPAAPASRRVVAYLPEAEGVLLRRDLNEHVQTIADLRWLAVCARNGSPGAALVRTTIRPVLAPAFVATDDELMHAVAGGTCDAAVGSVPELAAIRATAPDRYGAFAGRLRGANESYAIALAAGSALARAVPRAVRVLAERHVFRRLERKWLGVDVASLPVLRPGPRVTTVTLIGDSVSAALNWTPSARPVLSQGLNFRFEADSCRRLEAPSCGSPPPPTALQTILGERSALGQVVIMDVGYNDTASTYASQLDAAMRDLLAVGVRHVIWVTLRERFANYHLMNEVIWNARRRWPQLAVADWNAYSSGRPWFASDGIHLNASGAYGLAQLLRPFVAPLAS